MKPSNRPLLFDSSVYYFITLFVLVIAGFSLSYFAKFFDGTADFTFNTHLQATLAMLLIFILTAIGYVDSKKPCITDVIEDAVLTVWFEKYNEQSVMLLNTYNLNP